MTREINAWRGPQDKEFRWNATLSSLGRRPWAMHTRKGWRVFPGAAPGGGSGVDRSYLAGESCAVVDAYLVDFAVVVHPCLAAQDGSDEGDEQGDGQPDQAAGG